MYKIMMWTKNLQLLQDMIRNNNLQLMIQKDDLQKMIWNNKSHI